MEEAITFELIRKVHREEKSSPKPAKLPKNFFENVGKYLEKKRRILERKGDKKVALEVKNVERILEEVVNRRERKIINHAIAVARTGKEFGVENLTEEEKRFYAKILSLLKERREKLFESILTPRASGGLASREGVPLLVFNQDFPSFLAEDLRNYGPFKRLDVARLPQKVTKLLLKREIASSLLAHEG